MYRIIALALTLCLPVTAQSPTAADIKRVIGSIAEITGLEVKKPVPFETITRDGWKQWVEEQVREHVKPDELRAEELALKKFGLLPQDYDLRQATIDLLGEQAAAVYDHRRKRMIFVEGGPASAAALGDRLGGADGASVMNDMLLVHELSHALADQHFDLTNFIDKAPSSDEAQTARMAVVEGQAMWIMLEAQLKKMGASLVNSGNMLDMVSTSMAGSMKGMFPIFDSAPLYLKQTLMFPYVGGLRFQQKAVEKYGKQGFSEVLRRPPSTTREILHPEVWLANVKPARPALPAFEDAKHYARLTSGTVGELDFQILFTQYVSEKEASRVAPFWRGGVFDLLENKQDKRAILRWATTWENEAAARDFFKLYQAVLAGKWKSYTPGKQAASTLQGTGDDGAFRLVLSGSTVTGIEGLKP